MHISSQNSSEVGALLTAVYKRTDLLARIFDNQLYCKSSADARGLAEKACSFRVHGEE